MIGVEENPKSHSHLGRRDIKHPTPRQQPGMGAMGTTHPTLPMSLVGSWLPRQFTLVPHQVLASQIQNEGRLSSSTAPVPH